MTTSTSSRPTRPTTTKQLRQHRAGLESAQRAALLLGPTGPALVTDLSEDLRATEAALRSRVVLGPGRGVPPELRDRIQHPVLGVDAAKSALREALAEHKRHAASAVGWLRPGRTKQLRDAVLQAAIRWGVAQQAQRAAAPRPSPAVTSPAPERARPDAALERYAAAHGAAAWPTAAQVGKPLTVIRMDGRFGVAVDERRNPVAFDLRRSSYRPNRSPLLTTVSLNSKGALRPAQPPGRERGPVR